MASVQIPVVEDESIVALDLQSSLEGLGYDVPTVVSSGEEAIVEAERRRPALVLTDVMLAGVMDGVEAARLIPERCPPPAVMTAHHTPEMVERASAAGLSDEGFVNWLAGASGFPLHIATPNRQLLPGHGYVAPDGFHMGVESGPRIVLSDHAPEDGLRSSVAYLFRSVAQVLGPRAVGPLLTGMGRDEAEELRVMKDRGAITIAQDEASSAVHGMPGEAIRLGAPMYILPPEGTAARLAGLVSKTNGGP